MWLPLFFRFLDFWKYIWANTEADVYTYADNDDDVTDADDGVADADADADADAYAVTPKKTHK